MKKQPSYGSSAGHRDSAITKAEYDRAMENRQRPLTDEPMSIGSVAATQRTMAMNQRSSAVDDAIGTKVKR